MLNRKKTRKTGLDAILEVAGATMGDLGANLANMFDAEGAGEDEEESAEEEQDIPIVPEGEEGETYNRTGSFKETGGDNLQAQGAAAGTPPSMNNAPFTHQDSAILTALTNIITSNSKETTKQEFNWQPNHGPDNRATFKEEALAYHPRLKMFGFVQKGSPFVQLVHSPGRYVDFSAPSSMRGKIVAFMGDKTDFGQPHPFLLPEINAWSWIDVSFCDDPIGLATFYDDAENRQKLWERPGGFSQPRNSRE
jgi:hypothetical protein